MLSGVSRAAAVITVRVGARLGLTLSRGARARCTSSNVLHSTTVAVVPSFDASDSGVERRARFSAPFDRHVVVQRRNVHRQDGVAHSSRRRDVETPLWLTHHASRPWRGGFRASSAARRTRGRESVARAVNVGALGVWFDFGSHRHVDQREVLHVPACPHARTDVAGVSLSRRWLSGV
jgi:hypothetical protein